VHGGTGATAPGSAARPAAFPPTVVTARRRTKRVPSSTPLVREHAAATSTSRPGSTPAATASLPANDRRFPPRLTSTSTHHLIFRGSLRHSNLATRSSMNASLASTAVLESRTPPHAIAMLEPDRSQHRPLPTPLVCSECTDPPLTRSLATGDRHDHSLSPLTPRFGGTDAAGYAVTHRSSS
jgi:hypothetical protein